MLSDRAVHGRGLLGCATATASTPGQGATAIVEFLTTVLPENPLCLSKPLTRALSGLRSARRGDYRVLIDVDEDERRLLVVRVAHRAHAYRLPGPG